MEMVGVNTPEIGEEGYEEAKEFVNVSCLGEEVKLDVDDKEQYDPYYRILAVVYVNGTNLNEKLLREGYAEIMYIPPSEFNPREWEADYTPSPSPTLSLTPSPTLLLTSTPMLSPSPDYTPSPIPTPHSNISENSNEKISSIAHIVTIVSGILTVLSIVGSFLYRKKEKKSKTLSSGLFYLLIGSLVSLIIGIAIIIIIEFITMVFTVFIAIFTGIIAIFTIIIAIIAYLYAYHPKPTVFAHLRHKPLGIYVENAGRGIALNGKIKVCSLGGEVVYSGEFERLYTSQRYEYPTDGALPVDKLVNEKRQFIVKIDYEDDRGKSILYKEKISIPQEFI